MIALAPVEDVWHWTGCVCVKFGKFSHTGREICQVEEEEQEHEARREQLEEEEQRIGSSKRAAFPPRGENRKT